MALAIVSISRHRRVRNVIIAITIPLIPRCARVVVRSAALVIREVPYVDAARAPAASTPRASFSATWCRTSWHRS